MTSLMALLIAAIVIAAIAGGCRAMDVAINTFTCKKLAPVLAPDLAVEIDVQLSPNLTLAMGTILGQVSASVNDVQTFTCTGTPTGGSFTYAITNPLSLAIVNIAIPYNPTSTVLQGLVDAQFGTGNFTAGGGAWPGTPLTLTGANDFAGLLVPVAVAGTNALTGGTNPASSVAHTTSGNTAGTFAAYSSAVAAVPGAPTVSGTGSGSAFAAGTYLVQITGVNANGETTPTAPAPVTLTAGQKIRVAALSSLDTSFTALNVYVNGEPVGQAAVSAGTSTQTDFDVAADAATNVMPRVNTAFTANGKLWIPKAILTVDCATDANGLITFGNVSTGNEIQVKVRSAPAYIRGFFDPANLVGLDANAVSGDKPYGQAFKQVEGNTTKGIVELV